MNGSNRQSSPPTAPWRHRLRIKPGLCTIFHSLGSVFLLHVFSKSVQLAYERVFGRKVVDATYVQPVILGLYLIAVCFYAGTRGNVECGVGLQYFCPSDVRR